MNKTPTVIKIFTLLSLAGFIGYLIWGVIELINLSFIGLVNLILSLYFCIIFIGLVTAKKWSLPLLFILFLANLIYSIWININKIMTINGYISLGIMLTIMISIIYLLTREDVKTYFSDI